MNFEPLTPERRRAMTRQYLLDAAAIVFAREGFHGATLDDIAALAGFSKGAVYSNFKSKDDLFLALLDESIDRWYALTLEVLEEVPHDRDGQLPRMRDLLGAAESFGDGNRLMVLYLEFVLYALRNPDAREKLVASTRRERGRIEALIEHEFAARGEEAPHPERLLAIFNQALWNGIGLTRLIDPEAFNQDAIDTILTLIYRATGND